MCPNRITDQRYLGSDYAESNPTWDIEDSPWKARQVLRMLNAHGLKPRRVVDVGCGAGGVLAGLRDALPDAALHGYDIAPDAAHLWPALKETGIRFRSGDFLQSGDGNYDLMLLLDVIEHVANPFEFLSGLRGRADHYLFHIPLDLSAVSVLREAPLLHVRNKVGHIHYFTKTLALMLLDECGYQVRDWFYTGASLTGPARGWKTRLARLPRRVAYAINKDAGVRLLGGETMIVLAQTDRAGQS
ncbi:MAG: class I SAM-dependent methyltransferase [Gammaproteobacteria bacterium]|nr:class I SAM-dependent methyltransferase [Gammaproteobacteria bacterium]